MVIVFPVALVLGLLSGFGLAYGAEASDKTFRSAEEIRKRLGLAVEMCRSDLLEQLSTTAPAKDREVEAAKARARSAARYAA